MLTTLHRRVKTTSQSSDAYHLIKEKIITLELPPASVIDEARLIAELGLGRTPIREALQRLALDNLVVILPRRGTIVADLNMSDLQKIFEIRIELETYAVRLAAERATSTEIAAMEALFHNADAVIHDGDNDRLIRLDHEAHRLLAEAAHNEFLEDRIPGTVSSCSLIQWTNRIWTRSVSSASAARPTCTGEWCGGSGEHSSLGTHERSQLSCTVTRRGTAVSHRTPKGAALLWRYPSRDWHPSSTGYLQSPCQAEPGSDWGTYARGAYDLGDFTQQRLPCRNLQSSVRNVQKLGPPAVPELCLRTYVL